MTNWKKRPLNTNQIQYALNDVIHLNDLYHFLNKQLKKTKKIDYFLEEIKNFIESEIIGGGMLPKINASLEAVSKSVKTAHIIDGRIQHSVLLEIFTIDGIGTLVKK